MDASLKKLFFGVIVIGIFNSCLGSNPKKLGYDTAATPTITNPNDSFRIDFAYRDNNGDAALATATPTVIVQGARSPATVDVLFESVCLSDASQCTCEFYVSTATTAAPTSGSVAYSRTNNTLSCAIDTAYATAPSADPRDYKYVRVKNLDGTKASGYVSIYAGTGVAPNNLTISTILGDALDKTKVRKIYQYSCTRSFLEGKNVSGAGIQPDCGGAAQTLSYIYVNYPFFLYSANLGAENNFVDKTQAYLNAGAAICGLVIPDYDCSNSPTGTEQFGLYKEAKGIYTIAVSMRANPSKTPEIYGYAAWPDSNLNCSPGMIKIRPYYATPPSLVVGTTLAGAYGTQATNTNFLNLQNNLLAISLGKINTTPANLAVNRKVGQACTDLLTCSTPAGADQAGILSVPYVAQSPVLCALDPQFLSGL